MKTLIDKKGITSKHVRFRRKFKKIVNFYILFFLFDWQNLPLPPLLTTMSHQLMIPSCLSYMTGNCV